MVSKKQTALNDTQKALLLGIIKDMSEALEKAPDKISKINTQLYRLNRIFLETAMTAGVLTNHDKELLVKIRDVVEKMIHPLLETNELNRKQLQQAIKGLDNVSKDLKNQEQASRESPRPGKSS